MAQETDDKTVEFVVQAEHKHDFVAREHHAEPAGGRRSGHGQAGRPDCAATRRRSRTTAATPSTGEVAGAPAAEEDRPRSDGGAGMRMSDFVVRDAIIPELNATTKEGVIREMVESLRAAGQFRGADPEDIVRAILKRELLGSTGIGRGVAIPHTKHTSVEKLDRHRRRLAQRRRLREPRRRAGARLRPADLAAGSARRSSARPGKCVALFARRQFRQGAAATPRPARRSGRCSKGSTTSRIDTESPHAASVRTAQAQRGPHATP